MDPLLLLLFILVFVLITIVAIAAYAQERVTILAADIQANNRRVLDLGCNWDLNSAQTVVWGYYTRPDGLQMGEIFPEKAIDGSKLILVFSQSDMFLGEWPLSFINVEYRISTKPNC
jgi:hypothetical protein